MLDGHPLVILLASCSEVVVGPREPVEDPHFFISSANEKHVFPLRILLGDCLSFEGSKDLHEVEVALLAGNEEGGSALIVRCHAELRIEIEQLLYS